MNYILITIPLFVALIDLYFFSLIKPKGKGFYPMLGLLLTLVFEGLYLIFTFFHLSDIHLENVYTPPLPILGLCFFYLFIYQVEKDKRMKMFGLFLNFSPAIIWFLLYVLRDTPFLSNISDISYLFAQYLSGAALFLLYSILMAVGMYDWDFKPNIERKLLFALWIQGLLGGISILLLLYPATLLHNYLLPYLPFKLVEVSVTITLFIYLFYIYEKQLKLERIARLRKENLQTRNSEESKDTPAFVSFGRSMNPLQKIEGAASFATQRDRILQFFEEEDAFLEFGFNKEKLSAILKIPESTLTKVFETELEMTFSAFLNKQRIAIAVQRIKNNEKKTTVSELSNLCGYKSRTTFYYHFKKVTGFSISEYKKTVKNKPFL